MGNIGPLSPVTRSRIHGELTEWSSRLCRPHMGPQSYRAFYARASPVAALRSSESRIGAQQEMPLRSHTARR